MNPIMLLTLLATLPADDDYRSLHRDLPLIQQMIAAGLTGRKGKGGFYRIEKAEGGKSKLAIDLASGEYRPSAKPALASLDAAKAAKSAERRSGDKLANQPVPCTRSPSTPVYLR
mgnify:CR=1 FL=1